VAPRLTRAAGSGGRRFHVEQIDLRAGALGVSFAGRTGTSQSQQSWDEREADRVLFHCPVRHPGECRPLTVLVRGKGKPPVFVWPTALLYAAFIHRLLFRSMRLFAPIYETSYRRDIASVFRDRPAMNQKGIFPWSLRLEHRLSRPGSMILDIEVSGPNLPRSRV
jgi:hypothetical protein